jgi:serine/threonine protein kinase
MTTDSGNGNKSPAGRTVGGFEILARLGQGAMGAVFKARQVSVDRVVALKVLPQRFSKDKAYVVRFLREARAAAKLNHPHVVQGIDAGYADGYHYFAMEYVEGQSLQQVLRAEGRLAERRALELVRRIAGALAFAHDAGLIHRDVKPDNILLASDGTPKLADLGLAREAQRNDSSVTQIGTAIGTPDYIAPEQIRGEADLDGRVDIYSLGATLYHLVVGTAPYTGRTHAETMTKHLSEPVPDARRVASDVSPETAAIIRKAMAKKREARYASAAEMAADISRALAREAPLALSTHHTPAADHRPRSKALVPIIVASCVLLVLIVLAVAWPGRKSDPAPVPDPVASKPPDRPVSRPAHVAKVPPPVPTTAPVAVAPTTRPATPGKGDRKLLKRVRAWAAANPGRVEEAVRRYQAAIGRMTKPKVIAAAKRDLADLTRKPKPPAGPTHADAEKALQKLLTAMEEAVGSGDAGKAAVLGKSALRKPELKLLAGVPGRVAAVGGELPLLDAKRRAYTDTALLKLKGQMVELATVKGLMRGEVKNVSDTEIALEKVFMMNGKEHRKPITVLRSDLKPEALARYKAVWAPGNGDEALAAALTAYVRRDADAMAAALRAGAVHVLYPYYAAKLKELGPVTPTAKPPDPDPAPKTTLLAQRLRKLFHGKVKSLDPKTLRIDVSYDFSTADQVKDWRKSEWYLEKGGKLQIRDGKLYLSRTRMQALTRAQFTSVAVRVEFAVSGGTGGATLVICADGKGSHYELCGRWRPKGMPWQCQLLKYVNGKAPLKELGKKWPQKRSPYARTTRGVMTIRFSDGKLRGKVGNVVLDADDNQLKSGSVGVWAYDTGQGTFDNIHIVGTLDPKWVESQIGK